MEFVSHFKEFKETGREKGRRRVEKRMIVSANFLKFYPYTSILPPFKDRRLFVPYPLSGIPISVLQDVAPAEAIHLICL